MVLMFTATMTMFNVLPDIGLVLLLIDVMTDVIDLLAHMAITYLVQERFSKTRNQYTLRSSPP